MRTASILKILAILYIERSVEEGRVKPLTVNDFEQGAKKPWIFTLHLGGSPGYSVQISYDEPTGEVGFSSVNGSILPNTLDIDLQAAAVELLVSNLSSEARRRVLEVLSSLV